MKNGNAKWEEFFQEEIVKFIVDWFNKSPENMNSAVDSSFLLPDGTVPPEKIEYNDVDNVNSFVVLCYQIIEYEFGRLLKMRVVVKEVFDYMGKEHLERIIVPNSKSYYGEDLGGKAKYKSWVQI